ncbi:V-type ATP synthase subunit D [Thiohalomonas denitrificans]|uniref:V/A-type H+-transporting ATPase subunit D n=1 Tax=Thiohalomonas denitrificans TaxID=415747 RepID=A0A1G5PLA7_9GAMM|nr:V-type ATP synthase subunit D [Thiohalomonas denitrificans]SCZ50238.1 V/A-type H+-transporting ATPase subunit D [Thiohalomonas denitrificans]
MADAGGLTPTPSVLQELQNERLVVQEGYGFLDEKRLLLAAEILRQLDRYRHLHREYLELHESAAGALREAVVRHGLEGLQIYPPATDLESAELQGESRTVLGVTVTDSRLHGETNLSPPPAADPSPEARRCRDLFNELVKRSAPLAAITGNLERLLDEYRRTERRARALEDVLLPEIEHQLREVSTRLEELDQEETVRTRLSLR